jgi:hypothetical protein
MQTIPIYVLAAILSLLPAASPQAMPSGDIHKFNRPVERMALTDSVVERVVNALPQLISIADTHGKSQLVELDDKKAKDSPENAAYQAELQKLAAGNGFADIKSMQEAVETTMVAVGFINSGKTLKEVEDTVTDTSKQISADQTLSKEQKSALFRRMYIQVSLVVPSKKNLKVVQPFFTRIKDVLDTASSPQLQ